MDGSVYRIIAHANIAGIDVFDKYFDYIEYDLIIYCPIEFDFIEDGFRFSESRADIDCQLRDIINKYHQGKIFTVEGSTENRVHASLKVFI